MEARSLSTRAARGRVEQGAGEDAEATRILLQGLMRLIPTPETAAASWPFLSSLLLAPALPRTLLRLVLKSTVLKTRSREEQGKARGPRRSGEGGGSLGKSLPRTSLLLCLWRHKEVQEEVEP